MIEEEYDVRQIIKISVMNDSITLEEVYSNFSSFGEIKKAVLSANKIWKVAFEKPPNFQRLIRSKIMINGKKIFVEPVMDRSRSLDAYPSDLSYAKVDKVFQVLNKDKEIDWVFKKANGRYFTIMFSSKEAANRWFDKKETIKSFYTLLLPTDKDNKKRLLKRKEKKQFVPRTVPVNIKHIKIERPEAKEKKEAKEIVIERKEDLDSFRKSLMDKGFEGRLLEAFTKIYNINKSLAMKPNPFSSLCSSISKDFERIALRELEKAKTKEERIEVCDSLCKAYLLI